MAFSPSLVGVQALNLPWLAQPLQAAADSLNTALPNPPFAPVTRQICLLFEHGSARALG